MWFTKKKQARTERSKDVQVEILVEQEATKDVIQKAKKSSQLLNDILEENHITIKIFRAAGGK